MTIPIKSFAEIIEDLKRRDLRPGERTYLAHYSSYWNAICTDPKLLLIPVDDHMVHRGDGVFEAFRLIENRFYLLTQHLDRLRASATAIGLSVPWTNKEFETILKTLVQTTQSPNLIFRLFVSRGSGSFSTNPYDCASPQLTIVACQFKPLPEEKYLDGASIGRSQFLQKPEPFAGIKSCNYLPNVLMKKEAVDRGLDFVIAFNDQSLVTESSTENILLLSQDHELLHPPFGSILRGTTLCRCLELAAKHLNLRARATSIDEPMLKKAKEVFMTGTTLDLLPVARYEEQTYTLGAIGKTLRQLLLADQRNFT